MFISINTWYGIRYAQPPVGNLRWQAPQDIEANNNYSEIGVINAMVPGPPCVQGVPAWLHSEVPTGSEDCLLLDVKVPSNAISSNLPVMVQIHGGGMLHYS
jgi:carboxylesterase type B